MEDHLSLSDADLLASVRRGDGSAVAEFYRRYVPAARRIARRVESRPGDRDDLVSEAFVRIIAALKNGKGPSDNVAGYLSITIRRIQIEFAKARGKSVLVDDISPYVEPLDFVDPVVAASERALAAKAFTALPARWRQVLWLLDVDNLTPAQAAPALDLAPNAVSALANRARTGLKKEYLLAYMPVAPSDDCRAVARDLSDYVLGSGSIRSHRRAREHLRGCAQCTLVVAELRDLGVKRGGLLVLLAPALVGADAVGGPAKIAVMIHGGSAGWGKWWAAGVHTIRAGVAAHVSATVAVGAGLSLVAGGAALMLTGESDSGSTGDWHEMAIAQTETQSTASHVSSVHRQSPDLRGQVIPDADRTGRAAGETEPVETSSSRRSSTVAPAVPRSLAPSSPAVVNPAVTPSATAPTSTAPTTAAPTTAAPTTAAPATTSPTTTGASTPSTAPPSAAPSTTAPPATTAAPTPSTSPTTTSPPSTTQPSEPSPTQTPTATPPPQQWQCPRHWHHHHRHCYPPSRHHHGRWLDYR